MINSLSRRRLTTAFLGAAALAVLFAVHVFTEFREVRAKIVQEPIAAATGEVVISRLNDARFDERPGTFAVIWRIRNSSMSSGAFTLSIDGTRVCERDVPADGAIRLDCSVMRSWSSGHQAVFRVTGPVSSWSFDYLEIATHHGGTRRLHRLLVVPPGAAFPRPNAFLVLVVAGLVLILMLLPPMPFERRWLLLVHRLAAWLSCLAIALTLISVWVTPFKIVISVAGWALWAGILLLPRLRFVAVVTARRWFGTSVRRRTAIAMAVALVVGACHLRVIEISRARYHDGNYSGFLHIAGTGFDNHPGLRDREDLRRSLRLEDGLGYDGQFSYFMAFDPWVRAFVHDTRSYAGFIDTPPYRYGRVGFPLLTKVVSLDRPLLYPTVMIWLLLAGVAVAALAIAMLASHHGRSPMHGLLILLVPGLWTSLQYGLPEPLAAAFFLWGLFCAVRERWLVAGVLFAAAVLIRETSALLVIIVSAAAFARGQRRAPIAMSVIALAPYAAWRAYLAWVFYPAWGHEAVLIGPDIHGLPFGGLFDVAQSLRAGQYGAGIRVVARAAVWFSVLLPSATLLSAWLAVRTRNVIAVAGTAYGALALCLTLERSWEHVGNVDRTTFEVFLLLAVASAVSGRQPRVLRAGLVVFWILCGAYLLVGGLNTEVMQDAALGLFK